MAGLPYRSILTQLAYLAIIENKVEIMVF